MKKAMIAVMVLAMVFALTLPALAAGSKTEPVEIVETLRGGEHQDWTESAPSAEPTGEELAEATGVPAEELSVLWSLDYDTEEYPVEIVIEAPGTEGLPIYVMEYIDGGWVVIGTGTGAARSPRWRGSTFCMK